MTAASATSIALDGGARVDDADRLHRWLEILDAEDGGYDWGPEGRPPAVKQGDIVLVRGAGDAATRPWPCVVVQRIVMLDVGKLTACPLATAVQVTNIIRPVITPSAANGLRNVSQIEVDWILTEHLHHFGSVIGALEQSVLAQVDIALRRWLDL